MHMLTHVGVDTDQEVWYPTSMKIPNITCVLEILDSGGDAWVSVNVDGEEVCSILRCRHPARLRKFQEDVAEIQEARKDPDAPKLGVGHWV